MKNEKTLIVANVIDSLSETFVESDMNALLNQIEGHKYFLDKKLNMKVSFNQAAFSWMENVYRPIAVQMENLLTVVSFSNKERNELFFELCDHQLLLSINLGREVEAPYAVQDYCIKYGNSVGKFISRFTKKVAA
jgi:hypothetical protein